MQYKLLKDIDSEQTLNMVSFDSEIKFFRE